MRAISFVDKLEFQFDGNIFRSGVVLGDVDNDGDNELVVGNVNGDIGIFKGTSVKPWASAYATGMVTALVIGDIMNEGRNYLVSLTGDGWCNIFLVTKEGDDQDECQKLNPLHTQRLMANAKLALLSDVDGDGLIELVIGMTDRVVRSYKWMKLTQFSSTKSGGKLVAQNKWEFANQIGNVTLNKNHDGNGTSCLLIAQPGGTYVQLNCCPGINWQQSEGGAREPLEYHPLSSTKMRNPNVSTEIVGNIKRNDGEKWKPNLYAIATLDGTLMLLEKEQILWSIQVDHQLFVLTKLNITGGKGEEVVACSWDGQTYIINQEQQSLRFQFEEAVCTFTAGEYAIKAGENVPCFIYTTFNKRIYLYYNICVDQISTAGLFNVIEDTAKYDVLLSHLNIDVSDKKAMQRLYHWLLYGFHQIKATAKT